MSCVSLGRSTNRWSPCWLGLNVKLAMPFRCRFALGGPVQNTTWTLLAWHDKGSSRFLTISRTKNAFSSFFLEQCVKNALNLVLQEELHNACGKEGIKGKRLTKVSFDIYLCFVVCAWRFTNRCRVFGWSSINPKISGMFPDPESLPSVGHCRDLSPFVKKTDGLVNSWRTH